MKHTFQSLASVILLSYIGSASAADAGFNNATAPVQMDLLARYDCGDNSFDGGVMEIISYNEANRYTYAINGHKGVISILNTPQLTKELNQRITAREFDIEDVVEDMDSSFEYGDMSSIAVSPDGSCLAVALQADDHDAAGRVAIFSCLQDGSLKFVKLITVGVQPDMVCFANATTLLTANEGEPREGYDDEVDPKGSISIIDITTGQSVLAGFEAFDSPEARAALVKKGVILKKGALPSNDLEPEYITIAGKKAYVTLQENNAIAVVNLERKQVENIVALGCVDYAKTKIDLNSKDNQALLLNHPGVMGMRMPDTITSFRQGAQYYLVTANEGDTRKYGNKGQDNYYNNKSKIKLSKGETSPAGHLTRASFGKAKVGKVAVLSKDSCDGVDPQKDYTFGSRSFSIFSVSSNTATLCFDSGSDFERITAQVLPQYFNTSNDTTSFDDRSGKKGPEPESLCVAKMNDKTYAFIGLERVGGIMMYDISNPRKATFVNYINTRDFSKECDSMMDDGDRLVISGGDVAPESIVFVPADKNNSGENILLVGNEVSGTVSVIRLK